MAYLRSRRQGRNKQHSPASSRAVGANGAIQTGTVKWFNAAKGFGFLIPDDGSEDVFVHVSAVHDGGMNHLLEGQRVQYALAVGRNGKPAAEQVRRCGEAPDNRGVHPMASESSWHSALFGAAMDSPRWPRGRPEGRNRIAFHKQLVKGSR
jgi:CspA family cold shock protein